VAGHIFQARPVWICTQSNITNIMQCMKTLALRACVFIHCFLVFGYPGETLALVVHILLLDFVGISLD
jgi:hypothetical protein